MSRYFRAKITENSSLNSNTFLLTVKPLVHVAAPKPGQFYMIEAGDSYDPLLKRPFSYLRKRGDTLQFLYAIRGKGTSLLKTFTEGKTINMIGPLGNGYPQPPEGMTPLLIAGGTGIASIFSFCEELAEKYVLYGAKTKAEILMMNELGRMNDRLIVCTDDCSLGREGMVDKVLNDFLDSRPPGGSFVIYACGPSPMLRAVSVIAAERGILGYVSVEERMGCGFGACLGCAVRTTHGYKRACKEGPVFPIQDIVWI